jgi:phosphoribosylanthranilate isomerase
VIVQIYEVSTPDDAQSISAIGIDHVGVLLGAGEFPRELSLETARNVADGILPVSKFSALFLTANLS